MLNDYVLKIRYFVQEYKGEAIVIAFAGFLAGAILF